jgi:hypothetical protein
MSSLRFLATLNWLMNVAILIPQHFMNVYEYCNIECRIGLKLLQEYILLVNK